MSASSTINSYKEAIIQRSGDFFMLNIEGSRRVAHNIMIPDGSGVSAQHYMYHPYKTQNEKHN